MKDSNIFSRLTNKKNPPSLQEKKKGNGKTVQTFSLNTVKGAPSKIRSTDTYSIRNDITKDQFTYLANLDTKSLLSSIENFKKINLETASDDDIKNAINNIIHFNYYSFQTISENVNLYRARNKTFKLGTATDYFKSASEIWYPDPKYLTKPGRLNNAGQPMMYACFEAATPIYEIRSENDTQFALMKYKIKPGQQLTLSIIACDSITHNLAKINRNKTLPDKGKLNWKIINNFLTEEFTKKVPHGKEYMYRSTNALLFSFDFPGCDGFIYPSIEASGRGYNLAIKPAAADRAVEFSGLAYWFNESYDKDTHLINYGDFYVHQRWSKSIQKDKIVYEPDSYCEIEFEGLPSIDRGHTVYGDLGRR